MRCRLAVLAALLGLLPGTAAAAQRQVPNWAAPQIRTVLSAGLMGGPGVTDFRPNDPLTRQTLADLAFDLGRVLASPAAATDSTPPPEPLLGDPVAGGTAAANRITSATPPAAPPVAPTETVIPQAQPPLVSRPDAAVSVAGLDARLVSSLGLSGAAAAFARGARSAGLAVPPRFGTEVVARLLGLRTNHPAPLDGLELRPGDPATRAEAAYSAARILDFGWLGNSWQTAAVQALADSFALPALDPWQQRILSVAFAKIGMPYVWGGTSDGAETPAGVPARGGYDCSGFVWRVYKLQSYPDEAGLASTLRGRTTDAMSGEVPRAQRIPLAQLEPADVVFFGDRGPRSTPAQVGHMGIYVGNGWFIHSSDDGVALAQLSGWYRQGFAWGRRPLQEAGLTTS